MAVVTEPLDVQYRLITCSLISWSNTLLRCRGDCGSFRLNAALNTDVKDSLSGFEPTGDACGPGLSEAAAFAISALGFVPKALDDLF